MAKVFLHPIGSSIEEALSDRDYQQNVERMQEHRARLDERRAEIRAGWGPTYVDRVHKKGKLTTWERIERLKDDGRRQYARSLWWDFALILVYGAAFAWAWSY